MYSGVIIVDGNRIRFSIKDWKSMLAFKILSSKIREILTLTFRNPNKALSHKQQEWFDIWQQIFSQKV
jgi:ATP-dependent RNA helicase DHX29